MASWRDQKNVARLAVHDAMKVAVDYFPAKAISPIPLFVRVHSQFGAIGQLAGSKGFAEMESIKPRILFMRADITPQQNAIVFVGPGEAYRVQVVQPPDGLTVFAEVTPLPKSEMTALGFDVRPLPVGPV